MKDLSRRIQRPPTDELALNQPLYLVASWSGTDRQKAKGRVFSRVPASQFINLAVLLTSIALLRNDAFLRLLEPAARALLHGNRSKDYLALEPLSPLNWFIHYLPLAINLISMPHLYRRMTKPIADTAGTILRPSSRRVAQALFAFHLLAHLQGFAALLNHCTIDVNHDVNLALHFIFSVVIRTQVFGLGLSLMFGWVSFLPVFALVANNLLTWQSPAGGFLSFLSLVGILSRPHDDVSPAYKAAWTALALLPQLIDTSTDFRHMMATAIIDGLLAVMAFSLTPRRSQEDARSPRKD